MTRSFPATSTGARAARVFASEAITDSEGLAQDVALVVSELSANAVLHAATPFSVTVVQREGSVRVEVSDASSTVPHLKDHGATAPTGRGLRIVEKLTNAWGVEPTADGKTVWVELGPVREATG